VQAGDQQDRDASISKRAALEFHQVNRADLADLARVFDRI
jgi:hypothetical protein